MSLMSTTKVRYNCWGRVSICGMNGHELVSPWGCPWLHGSSLAFFRIAHRGVGSSKGRRVGQAGTNILHPGSWSYVWSLAWSRKWFLHFKVSIDRAVKLSRIETCCHCRPSLVVCLVSACRLRTGGEHHDVICDVLYVIY